MFTMYTNLTEFGNKLPDSMCLDSPAVIATYKYENHTVTIEVTGDVSVYFRDEIYDCYSNMPDELQQMFRNGTANNNANVDIINNNWYEAYVDSPDSNGDDIAELEGFSANDIENFCKDFLDIYLNKQ